MAVTLPAIDPARGGTMSTSVVSPARTTTPSTTPSP